MGRSAEAEVALAGTRSAKARRRRPDKQNFGWGLMAIAAVLLVGALSWWYRFGTQVHVEPARASPATAQTPEGPSPAANVPTIRHPIEAPPSSPSAAQPTLDQSDRALSVALTDLLGRQAVTSQLRMDGFARRFVATVDNLTRAHAPPNVWPVIRTPQRFIAQPDGDEHIISAHNELRYSAFVVFIEQIDVAGAVSLYTRLYPLFQQAYEELGYPGRYFNDRLVEVIDHLLAAPEPAEPIRLRLIQVQGPMELTHPWLYYEFADPRLESLSAGQKILVRIGPENERRLKARLAVLRAALVGRGAPR